MSSLRSLLRGTEQSARRELNQFAKLDVSFESNTTYSHKLDAKQHLITHRQRTVPCAARCGQMFSSQSAMVLHLEAFVCHKAQFKEEDVTYHAMRCYAAKQYRGGASALPFRCPSCAAQFRVISALLQHAESEACGEDLSAGSPLGRFLRFLDKQLDT